MIKIKLKVVEWDEPYYVKVDEDNNMTATVRWNRGKAEFYSLLPEEEYTIEIIYSEALRKHWDHLPSIVQVQYRKQVQKDIGLMMSRNALLLAQGKADKDLIKTWSRIYEEHAWCL